MSTSSHRIGLLVPSSNVTMEIEVPALLRAHEHITSNRFSVHASRMRMRTVSAEELARMDAQAERCVQELTDAKVDAMLYACLVAVMSRGLGEHERSRNRLTERAGVSVINSAGALVDGCRRLGVRRVAMICPYTPPLAQQVCDYLSHEGITVVDHIALNIPDNLRVAAQDPMAPAHLWHDLDVREAEAIIASACVQMPSLPAVEAIERASGLPTLSAATASVHDLLHTLELPTVAPGGGALLQSHSQPTIGVFP